MAGVPEWLQKGTLFEEEEREEWVGVYKLAGRPWPAKYDISGACCLPEGADAAAAQPEGADAAAARPGPPGAPRHKTKSRLARSDSDMDIDDPVLPDLPKRSLLAALESTAAVARAAASGQSCGEWQCFPYAYTHAACIPALMAALPIECTCSITSTPYKCSCLLLLHRFSPCT